MLISAIKRASVTAAAALWLTSCSGGAAPASNAPAPSQSAPASAPQPSASSPVAAAGAPGSSGIQTSAGASPAAGIQTSASSAAQASASQVGAPAAAGGPIKIGILGGLTGSFAPLGKDHEDGFNLYLAGINSTAAGRKIEAIFADEGQADVGVTKAKELVEQEHVNALMGITSSAVCFGVAGYVKQAQVPLIISNNCGVPNLLVQVNSPYITRITYTSQGTGPLADWAIKQNLLKLNLISADYVAGYATADSFAWAYVRRGGSIVQEQYPPLGTTDFGPYLTQVNKAADANVVFLVGTDALRFGQQYGDYLDPAKMKMLDITTQILGGSNLDQLKDKASGMLASALYTPAYDSPANTKFLKAWNDKYPGRSPSFDAAQGWSSAQVLEAAIKRVNGNVEDKQKFLEAIYATDVATPRGPIKLDSTHDAITSTFIVQIVKGATGVQPKVIATYDDVPRLYDGVTEAQLEHFPSGKLKGKWVGMTKDQALALGNA